jgi:LRV protein FeS4 cluster.
MEIDEALDWQGGLLDCTLCEQGATLAENRCRLGHACVHDRYARRIDRFSAGTQGLPLIILRTHILKCGRLPLNI